MKQASVFSAMSVLLALVLAGCASTTAQARRDQLELERERSTAELIRKGEAASSIGDMTRAEQYLVTALHTGKAEKEKFIVSRLLVVCAADQRYPVAAEYADDYLRRHPDDLDIAFAAASIHAALGHAARARTLLTLLIAARPAWPEPHFTLASVLRQDGDAEALALADTQDLEYLKLEPQGSLAEMAKARLRRTP
jgi:outer membrane protein assembly factor BamD (BamD/ComL family)